jgi:hypothetical protein
MGDANGQIAKLWRREFLKNNIGFDEIVLIGNNLGELKNPEFIPNVFQLINIVKTFKNDDEVKISHERIPVGLPYLMSSEEVKALRAKTEQTWRNSIAKMRANLK